MFKLDNFVKNSQEVFLQNFFFLYFLILTYFGAFLIYEYLQDVFSSFIHLGMKYLRNFLLCFGLLLDYQLLLQNLPDFVCLFLNQIKNLNLEEKKVENVLIMIIDPY